MTKFYASYLKQRGTVSHRTGTEPCIPSQAHAVSAYLALGCRVPLAFLLHKPTVLPAALNVYKNIQDSYWQLTDDVGGDAE